MKNKSEILDHLSKLKNEVFCLQMHRKIIKEDEYIKRLDVCESLIKHLISLVKEPNN